MNWASTIWTMSATVSLTLGGIQLIAWLQDRRAWANLIFSFTAMAVAALAAFELALMRADNIEEFATLHRWAHVPVFCVLLGLMAFIRLYFRTGRCWLAWTVVALRVVMLPINFASHWSFNFRSVSSMVPMKFLGETIYSPVTQSSPWARLGEGSGMLALVFMLDASVTLWRKGDANERRRAVVVGGSVCLCVLFSVINGLLIHTGLVQIPISISVFFLLIMVAMAYELSRDMIRAARMADELREPCIPMTSRGCRTRWRNRSPTMEISAASTAWCCRTVACAGSRRVVRWSSTATISRWRCAGFPSISPSARRWKWKQPSIATRLPTLPASPR
ncbi:MAG: hypothetical protein ABI600_09045 [Luteolibacter sp.]